MRPVWGIKIGIVFSVVLLAMTAVYSGTVRLSVEVSATVVASAAVAGLVFGLGLPLARTRAGAVVLGPLVLAPIVALQAMLDYYVADDPYSWFAYVFTALFVGSGAGFLIRHELFKELDSVPDDEGNAPPG